MLAPDFNEKISPPRILPSIVEGFNAIANRVYLILFPVMIDLILWFGPMVRIKNLVLPTLMRATEISSGNYGQETEAIIESSRQLWTVLLEGFNLLFAVRAYPVGIPSLMISQGSQINPVGNPWVFELATLRGAILLLVIFTLLGITLGSLYFALVARSTDRRISLLEIPVFMRLAGQSAFLSIILVLMLAILGIPAMCFISSIMIFLPSLGSLPFMLFGLMMVWVLLPLAFTPHGIFLGELKISKSIVTSVRLVRSSMAVTGIFFILVILIGYGLDMLWSTPDPGSWMMLVGIFGHAFISSGLLAASFVFYRDGLAWLSEMIRAKDARTQQADI